MSESTNHSLHAPYVLLQAVAEASLDIIKLMGLQSSGSQIAKQLGFPNDPLEALAPFELGKQNYQILPGAKGGLVCLKACPFQSAISNLSPWSEHATRMVQRFNASPRGGAALHPICISHLSVREAYGGTNLGCRSMTSGKIAVSVPALLDEAGMTQDEVRKQLDGNACLYWLKEESNCKE